MEMLRTAKDGENNQQIRDIITKIYKFVKSKCDAEQGRVSDHDSSSFDMNRKSSASLSSSHEDVDKQYIND